jgi:hypothetical protein
VDDPKLPLVPCREDPNKFAVVEEDILVLTVLTRSRNDFRISSSREFVASLKETRSVALSLLRRDSLSISVCIFVQIVVSEVICVDKTPKSSDGILRGELPLVMLANGFSDISLEG